MRVETFHSETWPPIVRGIFRTIIFLLLLANFSSQRATAQTPAVKAIATPEREALSRGIGIKLENNLSWLLPRDQFRIEVVLPTAPIQSQAVPYLPGVTSPEGVALQDWARILKGLPTIDVNLLTTTPLNGKQKREISSLITRILGGGATPKLKIVFKNIEAPPREQSQIINDARYLALQNELKRLENQLLQTKQSEKQANDSSRGADTQLKLAQNEATKLAREVEAKNYAMSKGIGVKEPLGVLLRRHIPQFAIALLIASLLLLLLAAYRGSANLISGAYQAIARSLQSVSDSLSSMPAQKQQAAPKEEAAKPKAAAQIPASTISIESADQKLRY